MTLLGCIADDVTGGSDVAAALRRRGLTVALHFGVPAQDVSVPATDAVVIALKTRTAPVSEAVGEALASLTWLGDRGVERFYFKYCSTFDSTPNGNIGQVADALLEALPEPLTLICPASPEHGRTTYQGHLFVGAELLSDSAMAHHPLTPMADSRIQRLLSPQTKGKIDHLPLEIVRSGHAAVRRHLGHLVSRDARHVVVDALNEDDLITVATAAQGLRLLTGGAGLAGALGAVLANQPGHRTPSDANLPAGPAVVLAGSCSAATTAQVAAAAEHMPSYRLDPAMTPDPAVMTKQALAWLEDRSDLPAVMLFATAGVAERRRARAAMGPETSAHLEKTLGAVARAAVANGARRVVVAGGETSGAVVDALALPSVLVEQEADHGVPWCLSLDPEPVALLLKSGNFGRSDLLVRAAMGGAS